VIKSIALGLPPFPLVMYSTLTSLPLGHQTSSKMILETFGMHLGTIAGYLIYVKAGGPYLVESIFALFKLKCLFLIRMHRYGRNYTHP